MKISIKKGFKGEEGLRKANNLTIVDKIFFIRIRQVKKRVKVSFHTALKVINRVIHT